MSSPIDLSRLPAPNVVEPLDFEEILAQRKAALIALYPSEERQGIAALLELESEPLAKLCQENAYRELHWRQRVNEAAKAVMIAHARNGDLDNLVANFNVKRLTVDPGDPTAMPPVPPTLEPDEDLRLRGPEAFEGLSVAGPTRAYEFYARSADGRVADARAISPAPCEALVTVLSRLGNGEAPQDLLDIVEAALTPEDIRPVGDRVTAQSADIAEFAIQAVLHLHAGYGPEQELILAAAQRRASDYAAALRKLGFSVYTDAIEAALHVEGVKHVELVSPTGHILRNLTQAAYCTGIDISLGGANG
ncbi:baseplate assembly protein [Halomonas sp. MCCC 1A17488]|uniref:baseplate J/gp47 family protein n=1 Tax=unclassified Halomonas TaxID=2609666 RepID=UPI0018D22995|nr:MULTISPECIES: baseplate J/gp47 family protein [unclassified Halomonas]MCE8015914.1 baseplate assembly protein [Halomonas sp. MCCC 1A17488]MCG3239247.1 baseplate assembly protein [Halomonas sp. MCCC 1A17488]QPP50818.1 baseplate J/gp47 family protein [Halomonas sp. SS10-MC5]